MIAISSSSLFIATRVWELHFATLNLKKLVGASWGEGREKRRVGEEDGGSLGNQPWNGDLQAHLFIGGVSLGVAPVRE